MWIAYALMSAVFAASTALLAKAGLEGINSHLATAIRTVVVLALAWGMVLVVGAQREIPHLTRSNLIFLTLSGLATGLSWLCYYRALSLGPVSKVAPIDKLSVLLTIALAAVFFHEPFTARTALGCLLLAAGLVTLM
jgi:transporter family protein